MAQFKVIEAQDCQRTRVWIHTVEADSEEAALDLVKSGQSLTVDDGGTIGDEDLGQSGFAACEIGKEDDRDLHDEAANDLANSEPLLVYENLATSPVSSITIPEFPENGDEDAKFGWIEDIAEIVVDAGVPFDLEDSGETNGLESGDAKTFDRGIAEMFFQFDSVQVVTHFEDAKREHEQQLERDFASREPE